MNFTDNSGNKFENPWGENEGFKPNNRSKKGKSIEDPIADIIKKGQAKLSELLGNDKKSPFNQGGGDGSNFAFRGAFFAVVASVILVLWLLTGFYVVQPDEEGVILRFGKYNRTATSGLNYKLPSPLERLYKISVTRVNREEIGFRSTSMATGGRSMVNKERAGNTIVPQESIMLTGDENIISIDLDVQWVIKDAKKFLLNVRDLANENTVKNSAESAIRDVIGRVNIAEALAEERSKIERDAKQLLQSILDSYDIGVHVARLQLLRVEPPAEVLEAYRDVQSSKADREREINQAYAYKNDIIPRARGEAKRILQEAEGYQKAVISQAQGDAGRFEAIYNEYKNAKDVTKKRMYLESIEGILQGMNKVIIDKNISGNLMPILPMGEILKKAPLPQVVMQDNNNTAIETNFQPNSQ